MIGKHCKIGNNVTITNSILWDNIAVGDGCVIENALVCDSVVFGEKCKVEAGVMLDHHVVVKPNTVLEKNLVASLLDFKSSNTSYYFQESTDVYVKLFEKGVLSHLPTELQLKPGQFMGQPPPYAAMADDSESGLEESDDDLIQDGMDDEKFTELVQGYVHAIVDKKYSMDCTLINMRQIKHGYSKDNFACQNAIFPAVFSELSKVVSDSATAKEKVAKI